MNPENQAKRRALRKRLKVTALAISFSLLALVSAVALNYRQVSMARLATASVETQRLTVLTVAVLLASVILAGIQIRRLMSAHTRYEDALAASERFVRMIADGAPIRMVYLDRQRRLQFVNQAVCDRLDAPRERLIGRTMSEVASELRDSLLEGMLEAAYAGRAQRFEHDDDVRGQTRRLESQLIPDLGPDGLVRGIFAMDVDITHLKGVERALRDLTDVIEATPDFVAQTNAHGELLYLNPAARAALGLRAAQSLNGLKFSDFYPEAGAARVTNEILPVVRAQGSWVGETEVRLHSGRVAPVSQVVIGHRDASGELVRYSTLMRDIADEVTTRRDLARQTSTLNAVIETIPAMVAVWDTDLRLRFANTPFVRWRGRRRRELIGARAETMLDESEYRHSLPWARRALAGEAVNYEREFSGQNGTRHLAFTYVPLHLKDGSVGGFVAVAQDVTQHREENVRLMLLTERDPLTRLLNRAGFEKYLEQKTRQGDGASLAVFYIDLDHFKPINDRHGHATGDEVLRQFASRLQQLVRPTDAVARLGGDEFAVVLAGVREPEHAMTVAEKIVHAARQPMTLDGLSLHISASVGVALDADINGGWKGLVAHADGMAYRAKANGRGQAMLHTEHQPRLQRVSDPLD